MREDHEKVYQALHYALACTRGILSEVLDGNIDKERIKELLNATAWNTILNTIDVEKDTDEKDWNRVLTESEKRKIAGIDGCNSNREISGNIAD